MRNALTVDVFESVYYLECTVDDLKLIESTFMLYEILYQCPTIAILAKYIVESIIIRRLEQTNNVIICWPLYFSIYECTNMVMFS